MASLAILYRDRAVEDVTMLLARASEFAKEHPQIKWPDIQAHLGVNTNEAIAILDWLAETHGVELRLSAYWIRCGRDYVLNNPRPDLDGMAALLKIGQARSFYVMRELEKRKLIRIKPDFSFERIGRMASFDDLVRQMKVVAKKYRGRCEPSLLVRTMNIDPVTAIRLAQYGEEHLGLRWKARPKELL